MRTDKWKAGVYWSINNFHFSKEDWKSIFSLPRTLTTSTRLQEFQLKILHKIYATDNHVAKFDSSVNNLCQKCHVKNDIVHWFSECILLKNFLGLLENWLKNNCSPQFVLNTRLLLFGSLDDNHFEINFCIIQAKLYIHKVRHKCQNNQNLYFSFISFLQMLKTALCIEREIAIMNMNVPLFEQKFSALETALWEIL